MAKNRTREYVHDRLYALAAKLQARYDPCKDCIATNCFNEGPQRCCTGCPHFKEGQGCTVQALYCKVWLCWNLHRQPRYWLVIERMNLLKAIAEKYNLLVARASRDETLEFGERLADDQWWLYDSDHGGRSRKRSIALLRRTAQ